MRSGRPISSRTRFCLERLEDRLAFTGNALTITDFAALFTEADLNEDAAVSSREAMAFAKGIKSDLTDARLVFAAERKSLKRELKAEVKSLKLDLKESLQDAIDDSDRTIARELFVQERDAALALYRETLSTLTTDYLSNRRMLTLAKPMFVALGRRLPSGFVAADANRNKLLDLHEIDTAASLDGDPNSISILDLTQRASAEPPVEPPTAPPVAPPVTPPAPPPLGPPSGTTPPAPTLPPFVSFAAVTARGGELFTHQIAATDSPTSFSAEPLPPGLQLDPHRGIISGITPLDQGLFRINLSATNPAGTGRATLELSIQGVAVPVIVSPLQVLAKIGKPFSYGVSALGTPTQFGADGLPAGLAINTSTGLISGTPDLSSAGEYQVLLTAVNAEGRQGSANLRLTVSAGEQSQIREYVSAFSPISVPEPAFAVPTGPASTVDEGTGVNRVSVTRQPLRDTQVLDRIVAFDPNADSLYAGAVVQGKDLPNGILNSITVDRTPVTLTVTGLNVPAGTRLSTTVQPTLAGYTNGVFSDLVAQQVNAEQPARAVFTMRGISTVEEGMLKLGASYSWIGGSVQGSFVRSTSTQTNAVMVRFTQNYFQVSVAPPSHPGSFFGADATLAEMREKFGDTGSGNPPAYVASISYGRELWMLVESTKTTESMETALSAAFNGLVAGGGLSVTTGQRAELDSYTYQVFVLGGGGTSAAKVITTGIDGVADFVNEGANFSPQSPGAPISYVAKYLWNSDIARVSSTADYTLVTSRPNPLAMLSRAVWYFRTHDDDKDRNNTLTLTLVDKNGAVVASQSGLGGGVWRDHTDSVLQLGIAANTVSRERMLGGKIRTAMGGDDGGWNFECRIELEWTDGTKTIRHISPRRWNDWGSVELGI
jgi:hypothetical protein